MTKPMLRAGAKAPYALWIILLSVCCAVAFATQASYSDYGDDKGATATLPYLYHTANAAHVASDESETQWMGIESTEHLAESAPVIVCGTFQGAREYAYQTFVSDVAVTRVIRGESVTEGDVVPVFEPMQITRTASWEQNDADGFAAFAERFGLQSESSFHVVRPTQGAYLVGATPMREGQEYLLFLRPKAYPAAQERNDAPQEYIMENSVYARIAVYPDSEQGAVAVLDGATDFLSFEEAQEYDVILSPDASVADYTATRAALLEQFLS